MEVLKENSTELLAINNDVHEVKISTGVIDQVVLSKMSTDNDFSLLSFDPNSLVFSDVLQGTKYYFFG